jgi:hypothetical protein
VARVTSPVLAQPFDQWEANQGVVGVKGNVIDAI